MISRRAFLATIAAAIAVPAIAHRQRQTLTHIRWNAQTSTLEITHTLHVDETRTALIGMSAWDGTQLHDLRSLALIALYVEDRFRLDLAKNKTPPLQTLGAEIDGSEVLVYQEMLLDTAPREFSIENRIFHDHFADQLNQVLININGDTAATDFTVGQSARRKISIPN